MGVLLFNDKYFKQQNTHLFNPINLFSPGSDN